MLFTTLLLATSFESEIGKVGKTLRKFEDFVGHDSEWMPQAKALVLGFSEWDAKVRVLDKRDKHNLFGTWTVFPAWSKAYDQFTKLWEDTNRLYDDILEDSPCYYRWSDGCKLTKQVKHVRTKMLFLQLRWLSEYGEVLTAISEGPIVATYISIFGGGGEL